MKLKGDALERNDLSFDSKRFFGWRDHPSRDNDLSSKTVVRRRGRRESRQEEAKTPRIQQESMEENSGFAATGFFVSLPLRKPECAKTQRDKVCKEK